MIITEIYVCLSNSRWNLQLVLIEYSIYQQQKIILIVILFHPSFFYICFRDLLSNLFCQMSKYRGKQIFILQSYENTQHNSFAISHIYKKCRSFNCDLSFIGAKKLRIEGNFFVRNIRKKIILLFSRNNRLRPSQSTKLNI